MNVLIALAARNCDLRRTFTVGSLEFVVGNSVKTLVLRWMNWTPWIFQKRSWFLAA